MKNSIGVLSVSKFYHSAVKAELKRRGFQKNTAKKIIKTHKEIMNRAKEIGNSRLVSSYVMGSYFIAMNRSTGKSPEENYQIFRDGLCASSLFRKVMGDAESYLSPKKMEGRMKWSEESHKRKYENDWVVDILPGNDEYDLGYDYLECGICKLCNDEGCPELAQYLCRMDFVLADIMNMKLVRTGTIAEGAKYCCKGEKSNLQKINQGKKLQTLAEESVRHLLMKKPELLRCSQESKQ